MSIIFRLWLSFLGPNTAFITKLSDRSFRCNNGTVVNVITGDLTKQRVSFFLTHPEKTGGNVGNLSNSEESARNLASLCFIIAFYEEEFMSPTLLLLFGYLSIMCPYKNEQTSMNMFLLSTWSSHTLDFL